jgi:hypothetical protein
MSAKAIAVVVGTLLLGCGTQDTPRPSPIPVPTAGGSGGSTAGTGGSIGGTTGGTGGTAGAPEGGSGGSTGGTGGTPVDAAATPGPTPPAADAGPSAVAPGPAGPPGAFAPCPNCKPLFDGKTLDGWLQDPAGSFEVKDGAIASTGKGAHAWTKDDYGEFRIFFSVRQIKGSHKPCTTLFNTRPANGKATRGLSGIQFQPPLGGSWDYRPGHNNGPTGTAWTYPNPRPMFDVTKWHRCEILAHASTGEFRSACCEIEGKDSCKGQETLYFKDATAGKKGPFALMMHNAGLFDEYKDIWIETDPMVNELLSTK